MIVQIDFNKLQEMCKYYYVMGDLVPSGCFKQSANEDKCISEKCPIIEKSGMRTSEEIRELAEDFANKLKSGYFEDKGLIDKEIQQLFGGENNVNAQN